MDPGPQLIQDSLKKKSMQDQTDEIEEDSDTLDTNR